MDAKSKALAGGWISFDVLGSGGNGKVYLAKKDGRDGAFKSLHERSLKNTKRINRFLLEIEAMRLCQDIPGVLPLVDAVKMENGEPVGFPWLVTEVATPLEKIIGKESTLDEVVFAIFEISSVLVKMHARNVSHRDIKPDNLFYLNDRWFVGDFGLADFENKPALTALHEKLGPMFYIAPEMLNSAATSDGKAADVYSLAKTLWKLATGMGFPLPGHQRSYLSVFSLSTYVSHPRAVLLDTLIEMATDDEPSKRPTMERVADVLNGWINMPKRNLLPALTLDFREKLDFLAGVKAKKNTQAARYEEIAERRRQVNIKWIDFVRRYVDDVMCLMLDAGLENIKIITVPDELNCHAALQYVIPQLVGQSNFVFVVAFYADNAPNCRLHISMQQSFYNPNVSQVPLNLTKDIDFLDESSEASRAIDDMKQFVNASLGSHLDDFISKVKNLENHG